MRIIWLRSADTDKKFLITKMKMKILKKKCTLVKKCISFFYWLIFRDFLEKQLEEKKEDNFPFNCSPKISESSYDSNQEYLKLKTENEELNDLNNVLKVELEKLSKQIEAIEKRKVDLIRIKPIYLTIMNCIFRVWKKK